MTDESQLGGSGKEGKRVPAIFFRTEAGREPVRDWLKSLPLPEDRKRIGEDIKTVEFGWPIGMPVCRALGRGLYEVRSNLAGNRIASALLHRQEEPDGASARLHQEDAEDPRRRSGAGSQKQEQT